MFENLYDTTKPRIRCNANGTFTVIYLGHKSYAYPQLLDAMLWVKRWP